MSLDIKLKDCDTHTDFVIEDSPGVTAGWTRVARGGKGKGKWIAADAVLSRMLFTLSAWKDCPGVEPEKLDEVDFGFILKYVRTRKKDWSLKFDSRTDWNEQ